MTEPAKVGIIWRAAKAVVACRRSQSAFSRRRPGCKRHAFAALRPEECGALSACFIRDVAATVNEVAGEGRAVGCGLHARGPRACAARAVARFALLLQVDGDFGVRLMTATRDLLARHAGAILVSADSPTLPARILRDVVDAT